MLVNKGKLTEMVTGGDEEVGVAGLTEQAEKYEMFDALRNMQH